ncbi:hypothetical protein ACQJBY_057614 [Aegilops geniculata]
MALGRQRIVRFDEEMGMPLPPIQQNQAALPAIKLSVASSGNIPIQQKQPAFPAIKLGVASSGKNKIFDPSSDFILTWNRVFLFSCFLALFIDPLYFYIPKIVYGTAYSCAGTDRHLTIILTFFRSITDLFYVIHIIIKFRTAFIKTSSTLGIFKGGDLVTDPKEIAWKYLRSDFAIDVVAALPLPQVLGALWYLLSVDRQTACWKMNCRNETRCDIRYLHCDMTPNQKWASTTDVFHNCNASDTSIAFDYGMFLPALSNLVPAQSFLIKLIYSFWWGLQNLSCYGQTLSVSTYVGETLFCIFLAVFGLVLESSGLVLFAYVIGNVQTSLQSITVTREDEWMLHQRDAEEWMRRRQLPNELRERVRRFMQFKWHATRGVHEEAVLKFLPEDLRRDIKRHLCLELVRQVPFFSQMDDQLLNTICARLVSSLCTKGTYIVREGDPVTEMLFIIRGELESSTTDSLTGLFTSITLKAGDFCGEELVGWATVPKPTARLPSATRTVKAVTEVEAFSLKPEDLKFVAMQFSSLNSKKLQHSLRFYSHKWRTWGARLIQAASRRYRRRKMAKGLRSGDSNGEDDPPRKKNL